MDTTQLLKGVLPSAVLAALEEENTYGYDLVRKLRAVGLDEVGDASVYGTLRRLYGAGLLTSELVPSDEGPARKVYGLNRAGREQLERSRKSWKEFTSVMDRLLNGGENQ